MNLSFSTLGCPGWSWNEILSTAKDLDLQGIEIRGLGREIDAIELGIFNSANIDATKKQLNKIGLSIPILTSGCALGEKNAESDFEKAKKYIDLASVLGTPYVRIMITSKPESTYGDFDIAADLYDKLCSYGEEKNVTPLVETNGLLANTKEMKSFLNKISSSNKGVLWDIHHPVRYFFELPSESMDNIGEFVKHVHVKDSIIQNGKIKYRIMGYGDMPIAEIITLLKESSYDGFISLEWVKRWDPTLEEPGIVFAHFKHYMSNQIKG